MELVGHSDPSFMLTIYSHSTRSLKAEAAAALDEFYSSG